MKWTALLLTILLLASCSTKPPPRPRPKPPIPPRIELKTLKSFRAAAVPEGVYIKYVSISNDLVVVGYSKQEGSGLYQVEWSTDFKTWLPLGIPSSTTNRASQAYFRLREVP